MREFFRGWKRKLGVLTLVLACMFAAGWIRSRSFSEGVLHFDGGRRSIAMFSHRSAIHIQQVNYQQPAARPVTTVWLRESLITEKSLSLDMPELKWRWHWGGFGVREFSSQQANLEICVIPYWSFVIPLTLLSAWLLLSKPRPAKVTTPTT